MTNSPLPTPAGSPSSQIRLPRIAAGLFIVSPLLLFVGVMTAFSTAPREHFERAVNQTTLGTVMIVVAIMGLLTACVLAGMRAIAQQQLDIMLQTERVLDEQRAD